MSSPASGLLPTDSIARSAAVLCTEVQGEAVLLDPVSAAYVGLDAVGTEIWRRLATRKRVDRICAEISAHFDGDPGVIARETVAFLESLRARDLIDVQPRD